MCHLYWQGFVLRNQTLDEELLISGVEISEIEDEIREIRELLDGEQLVRIAVEL